MAKRPSPRTTWKITPPRSTASTMATSTSTRVKPSRPSGRSADDIGGHVHAVGGLHHAGAAGGGQHAHVDGVQVVGGARDRAGGDRAEDAHAAGGGAGGVAHHRGG